MQRYEFEGAVTDGSYYSEEMQTYANTRIVVTFLDSSGDEVTPTDGTIQVFCTSDGEHYDMANNGYIEAKNLSLGTHLHPTAVGLVEKIRLDLADIAGADSFLALIERW